MSPVATEAIANRCTACGHEIPAGVDRCPACGEAISTGSSRVTLLVTLFFVFAGFALTQYFVSQHRAEEASLAQEWFTRGEQALQANNPAGAAEDFRTALSYDRDNRQYRLRLAEALLGSNRLNEARSHLLSLWELEPADGEVNVSLARLYVRTGNSSEAVRYYRNAINGVWPAEAREKRIAARFELIQYLMQRRDFAQASAELVGLQADAPRDVPDQLRLAQLLMQIGEPMRAIEVYDGVIKADPANAQAWLGKGKASLELGDYEEAEDALAKAVERDPKSAEANQQLDLVREVLRIAPGLRGLSMAERARRVAEAFDTALDRLTSCANQQGYSLTTPAGAPPKTSAGNAGPMTGGQRNAVPSLTAAAPAVNNFQLLYTSGLQKKSSATERALRSDPDALEPTMHYVFEVEHATQVICPIMSDADRALLILAQHEGETLR